VPPPPTTTPGFPPRPLLLPLSPLPPLCACVVPPLWSLEGLSECRGGARRRKGELSLPPPPPNPTPGSDPTPTRVAVTAGYEAAAGVQVGAGGVLSPVSCGGREGKRSPGVFERPANWLGTCCPPALEAMLARPQEGLRLKSRTEPAKGGRGVAPPLPCPWPRPGPGPRRPWLPPPAGACRFAYLHHAGVRGTPEGCAWESGLADCTGRAEQERGACRGRDRVRAEQGREACRGRDRVRAEQGRGAARGRGRGRGRHLVEGRVERKE